MNINTKFNAGETIWFMRCNQIVSSKAGSISILTNGYAAAPATEIKYYTIFNIGLGQYAESIKESELFATKEELVKSL